MALTPPSNQSPGDANNAPSPAGAGTGEDKDNIKSVSYFQKTVCLQDWWLIKAYKDGGGEKLGVAGFTSREQPALRLFASAPITKYYDMYTLETMDGVCVVLKGLINKTRTLEHGFPSEVFNHFVMGFPPFWEEFAKNSLKWGSDSEIDSREDEGRNNLNKGISEYSSNAFDNSCHIEDEKMIGEICLETMSENVHGGTAPSESSEPEMNIDYAINCAELRISNSFSVDAILNGAEMGFPLPKTSSAVNKSVLVESICIETGYLESSDISKRSEMVGLSFQKTVIVQHDKDSSFHAAGSNSPSSAAGVAGEGSSPAIEYSGMSELSGSSLGVDVPALPGDGSRVTVQESSRVIENSHTCVDDTTRQCTVLTELQKTVVSTNINIDVANMESKERSNCDLENLKSHQKVNAKNSKTSLFNGSKCKNTKKSSATAAHLEQPEKESANNKSLNLPVNRGKGWDLKEAAMYSEGRILTRQLNKSKRKQDDQKAAGDFGDDKTTTKCLQVGGLDQKANVDAGSDGESGCYKDGTHKTTKKSCRSTSRHGIADKKHCSKIVAEVKETVFKDASTPAKKTTRKLSYESPISKEGTEGTSVVSIESLSCKRSRSGRLLLPSLEFWRNQKLVYDSDGQITGIKEDTCVVQPSRGSKSEPRRKKLK